MDIYEIVKRLIGHINPVGEIKTDDERLDNLKRMTLLIENLLADMNEVIYYNKESHMASRKRAADHVIKFLDKMGIPD